MPTLGAAEYELLSNDPYEKVLLNWLSSRPWQKWQEEENHCDFMSFNRNIILLDWFQRVFPFQRSIVTVIIRKIIIILITENTQFEIYLAHSRNFSAMKIILLNHRDHQTVRIGSIQNGNWFKVAIMRFGLTYV